MRIRLKMVLLAVLMVGSLTLGSPIRKPRPQSEIEGIMQAGFGGYPPGFKRPIAKILDGTATKEETDKFVELCKKLTETKPYKGKADEWKKLTQELHSAAKELAEGGENKPAALKKLKAAADCKACHDLYQPTQDEEAKRVEEYKKQQESKDK